MIAAMRPGSIIVDLAAEAGGNCEATVPGQLTKRNGVTIIGLSDLLESLGTEVDTRLGYTDLPSRLPTQSSTLYSNNITKFLLSMSPRDKYFDVDLKDEVVRGSIVTYNGKILPIAPRPAPPVSPPAKQKAIDTDQAASVVAMTPWQKASREVATVTAGMATALVLGKVTGPLFMTNAFTFALAGLVGYRVVWGVAPALHSPLMSVTNAISGTLLPVIWP
jgi:NAD(P) transhydrogenase